jgi:branched-chain amino acid transport system permease protein
MTGARPWLRLLGIALVLALPALDLVLPPADRLAPLVPGIMAVALVGLGLNVVTGYVGLLHLGVAGFMAIGAFSYAILTNDGYPPQLGFWPAFALAAGIGGIAGAALSVPILRLRGDYLALVTLAFGEIVQDALKNLEPITKGTQGINPLPPVALPCADAIAKNAPGAAAWVGGPVVVYYLSVLIVAVAALMCWNLRRGRTGRAWVAIREDELAARAMGMDVARTKLIALVWGSALAAAGGALWAARFGSSLDPGSYDFALSMAVLAVVIVGGLASIEGVLVGAVVMGGFNQVFLPWFSQWVTSHQSGGGNVLTAPVNWKFMIFGLALVLMMRYRPQGIWPAREAEPGGRMPPPPSGAAAAPAPAPAGAP